MRRKHIRHLITGLISLAGLSGCLETERKLSYLGDADLDYYKQKESSVDYPDVQQPLAEGIDFKAHPRTLDERQKDQIWDLSLTEAIHTGLRNNRIIRMDQSFRSTGNSMYSNPNGTASIYDPSIQNSGVLFGNRGVEAALADFDTTFSTGMLWGKNETISNSPFFGNAPGSTLTQDSGQFRSALQKQFAHGGTLGLRHDWDYSGTNAAGQLFPSTYAGNVRAEYRHPLMAGSGTEFTRIAGPVDPGFAAVTGVSQGVVIARINNDITIADFQASVRNLVNDVENVYWDLYLAYRQYDTVVAARDSALQSWKDAKAKLDIGGVPGFKPADEAQAKDTYFTRRAVAQETLSNIYTTETRLRRLLGLPVNDGRVIRPADEPSTSEFKPDWEVSLAEALTNRVELRRQKWNIKSLELQLRAAESLTNPRLDFVSSYRVNGFGDRLIGGSDNDGITQQGLNNAYETLTQGNQTGWTLGFEFSMPIGFRQAHAQVRNLELRLAKAKDLLSAQELEISHELAVSMQNLSVQHKTAQSNFNRRLAAKRRLELYLAEYRAQTANLDLVLRAQTSLAEAEVAYYTSIVRYNQALVDLSFRKGTLLNDRSVILAESDWSPDAYKDALRRAWARSHAIDNPLLRTEPEEFVLEGYSHSVEMQIPGQPVMATPAMQPTPATVPPAPGEEMETSPRRAAPNGTRKPAAPATAPGRTPAINGPNLRPPMQTPMGPPPAPGVDGEARKTSRRPAATAQQFPAMSQRQGPSPRLASGTPSRGKNNVMTIAPAGFYGMDDEETSVRATQASPFGRLPEPPGLGDGSSTAGGRRSMTEGKSTAAAPPARFPAPSTNAASPIRRVSAERLPPQAGEPSQGIQEAKFEMPRPVGTPAATGASVSPNPAPISTGNWKRRGEANDGAASQYAAPIIRPAGRTQSGVVRPGSGPATRTPAAGLPVLFDDQNESGINASESLDGGR